MMQEPADLNAMRSTSEVAARATLVNLANQAAVEGRNRDPEQTDLRGILAIVRRHKRSVALVTLAALALAGLYLLLAKPSYTASATLFLDPRTRKIVSDEVVQGGLGSDLSLVESQLSIIASDSVLKRVVDKLALASDPEFVLPPSTGPVARMLTFVRGPRPTQDPEIEALEALAKKIKVKRAQKSYVIEVEVSAGAPVKAARLADTIAEAYLADQAAAKAEDARQANSLIDARLDELREQVRRAESRVDEFKKANKILTSEGGVVAEQQVGKLNAELATARAVSAEAEARYEQTKAASSAGASPENLPEALKSALIQKLREQYAQVARREAALSSQLRDRHPVLIDVRSQLGEIRAQISAELKRISESSKSEYEIAALREGAIAQSLERAKDEVTRTNTAQIKLRELEREADASRELLRVFLARAKETQEQKNLSTAEARVISPATVPTRPSQPLPWLVLSLGMIGGLGLGIGRALVLDHFDATARTLDEAATGAGLKPLAAIPELKASAFKARRRLRAEARLVHAGPFSPLLAGLSDTKGTITPAYRQAMLRLLNKIKANTLPGRPAIVMVASAHKGDGASATTLALAYAAALAGDRVLVVDACSPDPALSAIFAEDLEHDEVVVLDDKDHLARITTHDQRSGLALLPIARADLRTLKNQQRRRLVTGLTGLAQSYEIVLIDAGALLEDESAVGLLPAADQVILVARAGATRRDALAEAVDILAPARDRLSGLVLTMAETGAG
jgi:uncharacterized protein involved in exopolysaccharide biosynthesis/Mrp family chromosome partitioning ATPase